MGVPAFFRWLSRKYPSIVVHCQEEKSRTIDGVKIPVDTTLPNPNNIEFDNLYLDMNGIIHPCCHPENKPAPKNEDEMMVAIFEYIDRLFSIVRPRRLLYMAIDGVAPRAKMNQQRSRRFRASKESRETRDEVSKIKDDLRSRGLEVPPDKPAGEHFDSNCITPGTEFMFRLADCLRYYIHHRLNTDPGWANVMVILSDANVPGEGEHKIMDFIRRQRSQPDHDPNTHHCMCGADADLIMLGLATHEVNFTIIREEFKPNKAPSCNVCGQTGHEMKECMGLAKEKEGEFDELSKPIGEEQEFIFLRLNVLREYLTHELTMTNLPFQQDIERAIDDWVLMCFFVGNDFLPHLPSLEIREGAIDKLIGLYKKAVYKTGGYLTDSGSVNLSRVQLILTDLGELEDQIFKKRRETELGFKRRDQEKRKRQRRMAESDGPRWVTQGQYAPSPLGGGRGVAPIVSPKQTAYEMRKQAMSTSNHDAAASLKAALSGGAESSDSRKRKADDEDEEDDEPLDEVKLWEDGWKDRYYENKFGVGPEDIAFRQKVASEYVLGICWVLKYYYQGCASWDWYFPYHYAPFASDFVNVGDLDTSFEAGTSPFKPLEQLMSVFPAASKKFLPPSWQTLMDSSESPIIDFYPVDFRVDLNGKKYAWQGVALLPFVDEDRLLETLQTVYPDLTDYEKKRNIRGNDRLFVSRRYKGHDFLEALYEQGISEVVVALDPALTLGMRGSVWCDSLYVPTGGLVRSPIDQLEDYNNNSAICVMFEDPQYDADFVFPARQLAGATKPAPVLKPEDFNRRGSNQFRPQTGFQRNSGYHDRMNSASAIRHIGAALNSGSGPRPGGSFSRMPPPLMQGQFRPRGPSSQGQFRPRGPPPSDRQDYRSGDQGGWSGGGRGGSGNGYGNQNLGWQRNLSNNSGTYQRNQQSGYSSQGSGYGNQGGQDNSGYGNQGGNSSGYGNQGGNSSGYGNQGGNSSGYGSYNSSGYGNNHGRGNGSGYGSSQGYGTVGGYRGGRGGGRGGGNPYSAQEIDSYRTSSHAPQRHSDPPSRPAYPHPPSRY